MGRGRNRKPRNFATFRLCPRPGAADASDRVFVRVDDNPYSVPGFADDSGGGPPSSSTDAGDANDEPSSSTADDGGGDALPEHVRQEILELGLPDDGYDYLAHLREIRPSLSSTGGGGSSAVFLPSRRRPARSGLPMDVKAYDLSCAPVGPGEVTLATRQVEEAIDLDVVKLLDGSDSPAVESGDEDLEEDFVILANQSDEEQQTEEEKNIGGGNGLLHVEQFDSLALEEYPDGEGAVKHCETAVSGSYLSIRPGKILAAENAKKKLPKFSTGETSMKKAIIKRMENLPTLSGESLNRGPYKEAKEEAKES
ncbi:hypothetical protein HU200_052060 [Digitaria exilis]|uniref:Uncharacterized protein n=1 Tax=Digitaria exilis TaxID=1010633 RepID=A0A835E7R3_9POAL|nr:hypothetical protein HU200_052060 [Digitaria exilis]CAB3455070.1 unnamed protein product [Digitaria exilis]